MDTGAERSEGHTRGELVSEQLEAVSGASGLKPIPAHVGPECRELAEALRSLFGAIRISVRRYAVRQHYDPGTVSRYLNGTAVAPAEFVDRLLVDAAEALGRPISVEVAQRVTSMQRTALQVTNKTGYQLQVLRDQLAEADRRLRAAEANVEALTDALMQKRRNIAQMRSNEQRRVFPASSPLEIDTADYLTLQAERDLLLEEISHLQAALGQAQRQAVEAERRCEILEGQLLAAEESASVEPHQDMIPGRFILSYAGPDRPWAVWIRHRLEAMGHDAIIQRWNPAATAALQESIESLLLVEGIHIVLFSRDFLFAGSHTEEDWAQLIRRAACTEQSRRLVVFTLDDESLTELTATLQCVGSLGNGAEEDEREILAHLAMELEHRTVKTGTRASRYPEKHPPVWGNVPARNPHFTGRDKELAKLRHALDEAPAGAAVFALVGMPAIGKTQLAVEYAHRFATQYDMVWWVDSETPETIRICLAELACRLARADADESPEAALSALRRGSPYARWLLIFDRADEQTNIAEIIPDGPGHVLVTSQNSDWSEHGLETVIVHPLERAESIYFIRRRAPRVKARQAEELASDLGDHPLALAQAVAYLDDTPIAVSEYLERLSNTSWDRAPLHATGDYPTTFSSALMEVVRRIRESSPEVVDLINVCVLFAVDGAPLNLLRLSLPEPLRGQSLDVSGWQKIVGTMTAHSLVAMDPDEGRSDAHGQTNPRLRIHPLVRRVIRDSMAGGYRSTLLQRVRHALATADPCDPTNIRVWPQYAQIVPHLESAGIPGEVTAEGLDLILNCVRYLTLSGDPRFALRLMERIERAWRSQVHEDLSKEYALSVHRSEVLRALGHYERALQSDLEQQTTGGIENGGTSEFSMRHAIAVDLRGLGRYEESLDMARHEFEYQQTAYGPGHPSTLEAACSLTDSLRLLGRYSEALNRDRQTVIDYLELTEPHDLGRLMAEGRHAVDLRLLGHYDSALAQQLQTTQAHRELLGYENLFTLSAEHNLALCELRNDSVGEGLVRLREVREVAENLVGPNSPLALAARISLAAAERSHGDLEEGTAQCEEVLNTCNDLLGPGHPYTAGTMANLAMAYRLKNSLAQARELNEKSRTVLIDSLGKNHPWTLGVTYNLAIDLRMSDLPNESSAWLDDTAERAVLTLGERHPMALLSRVASTLERDSLHGKSHHRSARDEFLSMLAHTLGAQHRLTLTAHAGRCSVWTFDPLPI